MAAVSLTLDQQKAIALANARARAAQATPQQQTPAAAPQPTPAPTPAPAAPAAAPAAPAPAPAAPAAATPSPTAPPQPNGNPPDWVGDLAAGLNSLGDTASFGVAPALQRSILNFFNPGSGDALQQKINAVNEQHPLGAAIGTAASIPVDMALAAPVAAVAPEVGVVNALVRGGGTAGNIGRLAVTGATTGAINAATHGGDAATGAVVGGVLGPVAGVAAKPLAALADRVITPAATRAWRYLANKLGENPDQLIGHVQDFIQRTGQQPSLQQIVSDHDAGAIAQFGNRNPAAGEVLRRGAQESDTALPTQAQGVISDAQSTLPQPPALIRGVNPATAGHADILNARDVATDNGMNAIRTTPVAVPEELRDELLQSPALGGRAWRGMRERIADDAATLDDFDKVRRRLDKTANGAVFNPDMADLSDELDAHLRDQVPAYGRLMDQYSEASRYADSFAHGASGADVANASDAGLRAALRTPEGQNGFNAGALSRLNAQAGGSPAAAAGAMGDLARPGTAQTAFQGTVSGPAGQRAAEAAGALRQAGERARQTAPGALKPQPDTSAAAANVISGLAESPIAPISAARNLSRGFYQIFSGIPLSKSSQRAVAEGLVTRDPVARTRAIRMLRTAGVSDARIKLIQNAAAAQAARTGTNYQGAGP